MTSSSIWSSVRPKRGSKPSAIFRAVSTLHHLLAGLLLLTSAGLFHLHHAHHHPGPLLGVDLLSGDTSHVPSPGSRRPAQHQSRVRSVPKADDSPRIWIDVTSFAEGVGGWTTSLIELLHLARAINATLVEPCMSNGTLGSCFDHKMPASEIFDLSEALGPNDDGRPPLLASYDEYRDHSMATAGLRNKVQYTLCLNILPKQSRRCSGTISPGKVNLAEFHQNAMDPEKSLVIQLEDYWRGSVGKVASIFGVENPCPPHIRKKVVLPVHPTHIETIENVLRTSNIVGDDFSVIHFRAEKRGLDFMECAKAVVDAKAAMLEKMPMDTDQSERPFLLLTSLNDDPDMMWSGSREVAEHAHSNTAKEALAHLVRDNGFVKIDDLMKRSSIEVQDAGMLAVYDLILATKAKSFATCARGGGYGCSPSARALCERCNHVGKYGQLALSMRDDIGFPADSSWGCWPQTQESVSLVAETASTTEANTGGKSCDEVLDGFDRRFDKMRAARKNEAAKMDLGHVGEMNWWDVFEPEAACFTDERFGSKTRTGRYGAVGDGPKFLCGIDHIAQKAARFANEGQGEGCLVYSIGSNNDVSFERAVHDYMPGCEIHTFDPTLKTAFVGDQYATFHDWGVGTDGESTNAGSMRKGVEKWTSKSLETIMRELGHTDRTIDILKIDCQGCEYAAMPPFFDAIAAGKVRIGQLQIEMHIRKQIADLPAVHDFFAAADRAKLRIFHKERNHWGCAGYRCVEYAFVSESFLREANAAAVCPLG